MRYSTLASAVLLAVTTAPALAHPVTTRATEDASIVERKLQNGLVKYGYYDNLLSRDLEARKNTEPKTAEQRAAKERQAAEGRRHQGHGQGHSAGTSNGAAQPSGSQSGPRRSWPNGPTPITSLRKSREDAFNGELFSRTTEDAFMVERELQEGLVERGHYDELEARRTADPETKEERAARERQEMEGRRRLRQGLGHSAGTSNGATQHSGPQSQASPSRPRPNGPRPHPASWSSPREDALDGDLFTWASEDASMVERELQEGLAEHGSLLSRDLAPAGSGRVAAQEQAERQRAQNIRAAQVRASLRQVQDRQRNKAGRSRPPPQQPNGGSGHNGGAGRGAGAHHRRREYDLDGELFERGFEIDGLD